MKINNKEISCYTYTILCNSVDICSRLNVVHVGDVGWRIKGGNPPRINNRSEPDEKQHRKWPLQRGIYNISLLMWYSYWNKCQDTYSFLLDRSGQLRRLKEWLDHGFSQSLFTFVFFAEGLKRNYLHFRDAFRSLWIFLGFIHKTYVK